MATGSTNQPGDGGSPGDPSAVGGSGSEAGASGSDHESFSLSRGGLIAIIVVIVVIVIFGVTSTVLFYLAKKRSWEVRARIRSSTRKVVAALTPRRSEFPKDSLTPRKNSKGAVRMDEVPPTPRVNSRDLEKGDVKMTEIELKLPKKPSKGSRKIGV